jgi:Tol biopolymer transport system component
MATASIVGLVASAGSAHASLATTARVSLTSDGSQVTSASYSRATPPPSAATVAFVSSAANLVPADTNGQPDLFLRDVPTGTIERVNVTSDEAQTSSSLIYDVDVSGDGRYVAFSSNATTLVPNDTNNAADTFVRDRILGTTTRVSVDKEQRQAHSSAPVSISANGQKIAFVSSSPVVGGCAVYVRDQTLATTLSTNVTFDGSATNGCGDGPSLSPDGALRGLRFNE